MNKRDKEIIAKNPDMSAMELHQVGGLSKAGFDELVAAEGGASATGPAKAVASPKRVLQPTINMATPVNEPVLRPIAPSASNTVRMRTTNGHGNPVHINARIAARLQTMYPKQYKKA